MTIKDWPEDERPREKLLDRGPKALTNAELLAIFLRTGIAGKSAVDLARDLLTDLDGLHGLFWANEQRFCQVKGIKVMDADIPDLLGPADWIDPR